MPRVKKQKILSHIRYDYENLLYEPLAQRAIGPIPSLPKRGTTSTEKPEKP